MLQLRVILDAGDFIIDDLADFLADAVVVGLYFFLHTVVAVFVREVDYLR